MDPPDDLVTVGQPLVKKQQQKKQQDGWQQEGDEQTMVFQNNLNNDDDLENDLFTQKMLEWLETQVSPDTYKAVEVDERILKSLRYEEVFIVDYSQFCPTQPLKFFKNMVPDVAITLCDRCCQFFLQDEYEFAYMEKGHCPFCKNVEKDKGGKLVYANLTDLHR